MNSSVPLRTGILAVVLTAILAVLVTGLVTGSIVVPSGNPVEAGSVADRDEPEYLFTQSFSSGTLTGPDDAHLTLTLKGLRDYVTSFTNRPDRQANLLANDDFYRLWDGWFDEDPPNAVLSFTPEGLDRPAGVVVKLMHPSYDPATDSVTYHAVKIDKSEELLPGAEVEVVPHPDDPDVQDHAESFGPGMLFIDDAAAVPLSITGFFNAPALPGLNETVPGPLTVTPSMRVRGITVSAVAGGVLSGPITVAFGPPAATPLEMVGTFTWTGPHDWTISLTTTTPGSVASPILGTISDAGGTITSSLRINAQVGAPSSTGIRTPISIPLAYDGVGGFAGRGPSTTFRIGSSTFVAAMTSFSTASLAIALGGTMTTTTAGTTDASTYSFFGAVVGGRYSISIAPSLPDGQPHPVTLTGTADGDLTGSTTLASAVIGGMSYTGLSLTFGTNRAGYRATGTTMTNLGPFTAAFDLYGSSMSNIVFGATGLRYGRGLAIEAIQFTAPAGTAADPACPAGPATTFFGSAGGRMTVKQNSATFSNPLSLRCGTFASAAFTVNLVHAGPGFVRNLTGTIYYSAQGGSIEPCPATTDPINGACGRTVPYLEGAIASNGPFFAGSVTYAPRLPKKIYLAGSPYQVYIAGTMGMGIAAYTDASGAWAERTSLGGSLRTTLSVSTLGVGWTAKGSGPATCVFDTSAGDYVCSASYVVTAVINGSTYQATVEDTGL